MSSGFRADIQGLRAVAVLLVLVNHAFQRPSGGFIGVDVFYVISGFLITGLMLREWDRNGNISLSDFYLRRLRRIAPAALVVLAATVIGAQLVWYAPQATQVTLDALSALLFVANWHFLATGTDYLQAGAQVSPIQHYWSLSIEEQFYAIWPLILIGILALTRSRRVVLAVVLLLGAASITYAGFVTSNHPIAAYFDTFGRAWELFAGALLALLPSAASYLHPWIRRGLTFVGLAALGVLAIEIDTSSPVPYPAIIPVIAATVLIIWSNAPAPRTSILGNPVSQWLGNISYSLYLWHFPILIFATTIFGSSLLVQSLALVSSVVVADLSRRFIEQPAMKLRFLQSRKTPGSAVPSTHSRSHGLVIGSAVLAVIVCFSSLQIWGPTSLRSSSALASTIGVEPGEHKTLPDEASWAKAVADASTATEWSTGAKDDLDKLYDFQLPSELDSEDGCLSNVWWNTDPRWCGEPETADVLVLGDSVTLAWTPAVREASGNSQVAAMGFGNCSLVDVEATDFSGSQGFIERCSQRRAEMHEAIQRYEPSTIVVSAAESTIGFMNAVPAEKLQAEWAAGLERMFDSLSDVPNVVFVSSPPRGPDPATCSLKFRGPSECMSPMSYRLTMKTDTEADVAAKYSNVTFVDTRSWFCTSEICPPFIGEMLVRADASHLTHAMSKSLGRYLEDALR